MVLPDDIINHHDPQFISKFWKDLLELLHISWKLCFSYSSKSQCSNESTNQTFEKYLHCFINSHTMIRLTFNSSQKLLIILTCFQKNLSLRLRIMCGFTKQHKKHRALQQAGLWTSRSVQNITVSNQWECLCLIKVYSFDLSAVGRAEDCSAHWNP